jgi:hypothetical protein
MTATAELARAGAKGIDCNTVLTSATCVALKNSGIEFVVRYARDVKPDEFNAIIDAGLAVMGCGHVRYPPWKPNAGMGALDGMNLANFAQRAGFATGTTLWCDIEGVSPECSSMDVIVYANAWFDAVSSANFQPGVYVGFQSILTASQWFHALKMTRYWKSGSNVPTPEQRGFCNVQGCPLDVMLDGILVDHDFIQPDNFGDLPMWSIKTVSLPNV